MKYLIYIFNKQQQEALSILLENQYRHFLKCDLSGLPTVGVDETYDRIINLNQAHAKMVDSLKEEMNDVLEDKKFILTDHAVLWIEKSLEIFYSEPKLITTTEAKKVQSMYESLCNAIFDTPKIYMTQDEIHMMI